jgi:hypothetical protein
MEFIVGVVCVALLMWMLWEKDRRHSTTRAQKRDEEHRRVIHQRFQGRATDAQLHAMANREISRGMSEEQVVAAWGQPSRRDVVALKTKTKTTLIYGSKRGGNHVVFENGSVVGWKTPNVR